MQRCYSLWAPRRLASNARHQTQPALDKPCVFFFLFSLLLLFFPIFMPICASHSLASRPQMLTRHGRRYLIVDADCVTKVSIKDKVGKVTILFPRINSGHTHTLKQTYRHAYLLNIDKAFRTVCARFADVFLYILKLAWMLPSKSRVQLSWLNREPK